MIVLVILLSGGAGVSLLVHSASVDPTGNLSPSGSSIPALSASPSEQRVQADSTTTLWASWSEPPSGCTDSPLWFHWSLADGLTEGELGPASQPMVNFTADAGGSGTALVNVRSELLLACGTSLETTLQTATATVAIVAPLEVENLTVVPNPVLPGSLTNLSAIVANGDPPYLLHIVWGDGSAENITDPVPGPISIGHRFPVGWFAPSVLIEDSIGDAVSDTVEEALSVSSGPAVGILPPAGEAEVGVPVAYTIALLRPPSSYVLFSECAEPLGQGEVVEPLAPGARSFNCTFQKTGIADVGLRMETSPGGDPPAMRARLLEPVAAPLGLAVGPTPRTTEAGRPSAVMVEVSGGVPPFQIAWTLVGNVSWEKMAIYSDGPIDLPFWPDQAGGYPISIGVTDAAGEAELNQTARVPVDGPLAIDASVSRTLTEAGAVASVLGNITAGAPPFRWCIVPSYSPLEADVGEGASAFVGPFTWNETFPQTGEIVVSIVVLDGDGNVWTETSEVSLVPPMNVTARVFGTTNASGQFVDLDLSIVGGVPPFGVNLTSTDDEQWNVSVPSDGTFSWIFVTNDSGTIGVLLEVRDPLADVWTATRTLVIPSPTNSSGPPPVPPPGDSPPSAEATSHASMDGWLAGLGIMVVAALCGGGLLIRRRRRPSERNPNPRPDPVAVVRRIVEPAEGAERSTVELLAEEAGVPLETVRTTIDRLIDEGTLRAETGDDGEEVLAWSEPP